MPHLPLEERVGSFSEVELGFDEEGARKEARRCLSCRRCIGCGLCLAECDPRAVVYDDEGRTIKLKVGAVVLAPGRDEFDAGRISELGYRTCPNVITNIELERMLSPTGPYGGMVLRPYDGEIPSSVAFVQCVGSRNEAIGADYCSSICCMSAMREAVSLTQQIEDVHVKILHRDIRPLGKDSEEYYQSVRGNERVSLVPGTVAKIEETAQSKNVVVQFSSNGETQKEEFELVVLSVGVRPSATARGLSGKARVKLNKYGFCHTDSLNATLTGKKGVVVAGAFAGPGNIQGAICQADAAAAAALRSLGREAPVSSEEGAGSDKRGQASRREGGESTAADKEKGRGSSPHAGEQKTTPSKRPRGSAGVFVCKYGLSASSRADAEELVEELRATPDVSLVVSSEFLCVELSRPGFRDEIARAGISRALIVPCYEPTYEPLFIDAFSEVGVKRGGVSVLDVSSRSGADKQEADASRVKKWVAECLKAQKEGEKTTSQAPSHEKVNASALVIGGGLAGLTAALELSSLGHRVTVIEKNEEPGGRLLDVVPLREKDSEKDKSRKDRSSEEKRSEKDGPQDDVLSSLREAIEKAEGVDLHTSTELVRLSGEPGGFSAVLKSNGGERTEDFGAVVVCTGGQEYVPDGLLHGKDKRILTQLQFEKILAGGRLEGSSVVMVQCVGSRISEWPVCSRTCCVHALKNALKVKELKTEAKVTILHRDIRVYSMEEEFLSEALEKGVEFVRMSDDFSAAPSGRLVELKAGEQLSLSLTEQATGTRKTISADYVVLSTGLRPQADAAELAGVLGVDIDEKGFFREVHPELRPVESSRRGIYVCGLAHSPQTAQETVSQAIAAAKKASSVLSVSTGRARD